MLKFHLYTPNAGLMLWHSLMKLDRVNCADSAFIIFELLYNYFKNMPHVFSVTSCVLCICVFVYLNFCICLFDIWEYHL